MVGAIGPALSKASNGKRQELTKGAVRTILSFDVEEHHRIEAAVGLNVSASLQAHYCARLEPPVHWLIDQLAQRGIKATFFLVGQIAQRNLRLIRAIHRAGHEVASHGWNHQRIHHLTPASFREDVLRSKDALEQVTGEAVLGYRAPTFSIVRETSWALDVLAELGFVYDSSIFPVQHDRYGVPQAPRVPFRTGGRSRTILEIPPATLRVLGANVPVGGGGYFRLWPSFLLESALWQVQASRPAVAMLYFHPWEFDPRQARLPLGALSRFRTYVGIYRSRARFRALLSRCPDGCFVRAIDVARELDGQGLPGFHLT